MSVYFIRPIGMAGPVKIGCSHLPSYRLKSLSTWSPFELEIAAEMDGGLKLERRFHNMFAESHTHREWFKWTPELELVIQAVKAGTFNFSSLPDSHTPLHQQNRAIARDRAFDTPGHRYAKSVSARLSHLRNRGMQWNNPTAQEIGFYNPSWSRLDHEQLEALRATVEPRIAELSQLFPKLPAALRNVA